ncbi:endonuclease/exonuclease/phosphatase family protein [Cupriavidus taiwanensis]|uniref:endonuclease/exonuclease/phosphatase family protein n=1 Tax=Cupriavidus taiwanensis TaxID=164546 RepID=UPI00253FC5EB|nr:endonuclease/exonuclease/phosphatase family protein [Cupriavidus taiwanensis]MDK3025464.1 endonuclease/exonuclease/phosphatase family protein [Cupriavidus taiwanensis]
MWTWKHRITALTAICSIGPAAAAEIGIASFNLAWAGTEADFARHVAVCSAAKVSWCNSRPRIAKGASVPTEAEAARAQRCQSAFDTTAGGPAAALLVAPCNAYKLSAKKWAAGPTHMYADKIVGLRETVEKLIVDDHIDVIAFQEVRSDDVIRSVLGRFVDDFQSCVAVHSSFQTVGFAWRKTVSAVPAQCVAAPQLSIKEDPNDNGSLKTMRPGLALSLTIGTEAVTFMNAHLKSGCANVQTDGAFEGHLLTDPVEACQTLNRQIAPLEAWVEDVARTTSMFVLLGDFNRRLDEEAAARPLPTAVREDGSDPAGPNPADLQGRVPSRYLWQELSDGKPSLVQVPLGQQASGCTGFTGLDHILISESLRARQDVPPVSVKTPVMQQPGQAIESSDHCPRVTKLTF